MIKIEASWYNQLWEQFSMPYFISLTERVKQDYLSGCVYPEPKNIFRAFELCPFDKVKVVIIGQDPYHGPNQAIGLSFAVSEKTKLPPSLKNIYKEIKNDLGIDCLPSGDLSRWANQGVLLLNAVLTVMSGLPTSHRDIGWERFTDAVIAKLNAKRKNIVYMLWGKYAQAKGAFINRNNNLILTSSHPSPYSATGFFGQKHFSQCNNYLRQNNQIEIDWH